MYYENKSLEKRFIEKDPYFKERILNKYTNGKSILRGHIPNFKITNFHFISDKLRTCDGFGKKIKIILLKMIINIINLIIIIVNQLKNL